MGKVNNVRRAVAMLQEIPIVVSLFVFVCYFTDFCNYNICKYTYPIFGSSMYIMLRLYFVARRLYVSKWSLVLYFTLSCVSLIELIDNIFGMPSNAIAFHQILQTVFISGIFSSFVTFLYGKYKNTSQQHN